MNLQDVKNLANGFSMFENQQQRDSFINNYHRLKDKSQAFAPRLNEWLKVWYEQHKNMFIFVEVDDFDADDMQGYLQMIQNRFAETGKIHIWKGASDDTIFGNNQTNLYFRCWHDLIHVQNGLGFDLLDESIVSAIQQNELPNDWYFEKELVHCEIVGQAQYFMKYGEFLKRQRDFTIEYLISPLGALKHRQ